MELNEYQDLASRTAKFPERPCPECGVHAGLAYTPLGLGGETGEVLELVKKMMRDDGNVLTDERRGKLKKELGDVLWYLSQVARMAGLTLDEIAATNILKLHDRQERGAIHGSGSDR